MNKPVQRVPAVRIEAKDSRPPMLLIQTPAEKKLLMWHTERKELFVRFMEIERAHPSIIRDWGINE